MRENDWHDSQWRAGADGWIRARLTRLGTPVTGAVEEIRVRPWSVTYRVATNAGVRWFKANITTCAYEAGLAEALAGWVPGRVLAPLAVDRVRGWLLTADAGPTLRDQLDGASPEKLLDTWATMLREYAVLQRAVAGRADEMVALGVPDVRPATMPDHLAALLADPEVRRGLEPAPVEAIRPAFAAWCAELAADGIPATLQHDDLTDANVFADGRFFDWGDAGVAHPFGSLLVALGFAAHLLGLTTGAPEITRLRDAYLEPWSDLAPPADLRRSVSLAVRTARVSRALAWQRALHNAALPVDDDFRTAAAYWLGETPAPSPI